jgi:hypothetical protein
VSQLAWLRDEQCPKKSWTSQHSRESIFIITAIPAVISSPIHRKSRDVFELLSGLKPHPKKTASTLWVSTVQRSNLEVWVDSAAELNQNPKINQSKGAKNEKRT